MHLQEKKKTTFLTCNFTFQNTAFSLINQVLELPVSLLSSTIAMLKLDKNINFCASTMKTVTLPEEPEAILCKTL